MMIYFIHNDCGDSRRFGLAPGEMAFKIGRTHKGHKKTPGSLNRSYVLVVSEELENEFVPKEY